MHLSVGSAFAEKRGSHLHSGGGVCDTPVRCDVLGGFLWCDTPSNVSFGAACTSHTTLLMLLGSAIVNLLTNLFYEVPTSRSICNCS